MSRVATILLGAAIAVAFLAGCGSGHAGGTPRASSTNDHPTSTTSVDDATDGVPPFPPGTAPQTAEKSGTWDLVFKDVRVVEREGFDRIELEFTGAGAPGWGVDYVDEAVLEGSGKHVRLDGDAFLNISASGTTWPAPGYYDGPTQFEPENDGGVADVYVGGTFEGYTQVLVGIGGGRVPFRAFALTEPSRLVVDVVDDGAAH